MKLPPAEEEKERDSRKRIKVGTVLSSPQFAYLKKIYWRKWACRLDRKEERMVHHPELETSLFVVTEKELTQYNERLFCARPLKLREGGNSENFEDYIDDLLGPEIYFIIFLGRHPHELTEFSVYGEMAKKTIFRWDRKKETSK